MGILTNHPDCTATDADGVLAWLSGVRSTMGGARGLLYSTLIAADLPEAIVDRGLESYDRAIDGLTYPDKTLTPEQRASLAHTIAALTIALAGPGDLLVEKMLTPPSAVSLALRAWRQGERWLERQTYPESFADEQ